MCEKPNFGNDALIPDDEESCSNVTFYFDENGTAIRGPTRELSGTIVGPIEPIPLFRPCSLATLNGSWLIQIGPNLPYLLQISGPMRIESKKDVLRISGDIYTRGFVYPPRSVIVSSPVETAPSSILLSEPIFTGSLVIKKNWYPAYPQRNYRWYFRSQGCRYDTKTGTLSFKFERHLWNTRTQEFTSKDNGWMSFNCSRSIITWPTLPAPTISMTGKASIGGKRYTVTATKTSPYYRGCQVEVDVMQNRSFPSIASNCDNSTSYSFESVYREAGMDFKVVLNQTNIPDDPLLTIAELHNLLSTYRTLSPGWAAWRLWLFVGSRMDGYLGVMFDTNNPPHREGAVGFYDPKFGTQSFVWPSAHNKRIGEVSLAFLRTLIHEAGHVFNLLHPPSASAGKTIMNQTGTVMGSASAADPYPCNAVMGFNDHNTTSLIHSPDPQVKPGWKEFGWGSSSSGIAEPVDVIGLDLPSPEAEDLHLELDLPIQIHRGEYVIANVTVVNTGSATRPVSAALNLSEGDLRLHVKSPSGEILDVRDIVHIESERRVVNLAPNGEMGDRFSHSFQLFYTNNGFLFDQPGRYEVQAELEVGDGSVVHSKKLDITLRPPATEVENAIESNLMDADVGLSLALGDFGTSTVSQNKLTTVAEAYGGTDSGAAAAMVIANSLDRTFRDTRTQKILRKKDKTSSTHFFDIAARDRSATDTMRIAASIVSYRETSAPLLDLVKARVEQGRKDGVYTKEDADQADKLLDDHFV